MEPLSNGFRDVGRRLQSLPASARWGLALLVSALVVVVGINAITGSGAAYQYAFTNLTPEDSSEAAGALKAAGIPFRAEAGGSALAVPASKVHDARLFLAAQGLPRGGGVGFELFDRGDLGTSEFTQRVNLRRATEGELARTIGRLAAVRSSRVHLTLPERGLYRDDDRRANAAVVLNLQPGRVMQDRELAGIRHLVASAVPGLNPDGVTIMDGRGTVLSGSSSSSAKLATQQREVESALEQRIVDLLEPAVGRSAVVAKVTATLDTTEIETTEDKYDPDNVAVRSERKTSEQVSNDATTASGVAGAAANQPLGAQAGGGGNNNKSQTSREDEVKNYEVPKKVTHTIQRSPRLVKLSAAVLVDGIDGKPRAEAEIRRLSELAKSAMGFDQARGDKLEISSAPFAKREEGSVATPVWARPEIFNYGKLLLGAVLVGAMVMFIMSRARRGPMTPDMALLKPGSSVAELEAAFGRRGDLGGRGDMAALVKERARELGKTDPARAAHLLRAWIAADTEGRGAG